MGHGGMSLPAQAAPSATAAAAADGGAQLLHGAAQASAPRESHPGPRSSGAAALHNNSNRSSETAVHSHGEYKGTSFAVLW